MTGASSLQRRCTSTGVHLVADNGEQLVRVAKPAYGALSAPERPAGGDRRGWGRYDSPGCTVYAASNAETAYAEVLSPYKRQLGAVDPLEKDAAALGLTRDELLEIVSREWSEANFMGLGAVPRQWRADRFLFSVWGVGDTGWYIDVEHPDTIAFLEVQLEQHLADWGVASLTTGVLRSEQRPVTTAVAECLRQLELDTGTRAMGIQFGSKFGGGWCRAVWVPTDTDDWLADVVASSGDAILISDESLARACNRFRIHAF